MNHSTEASPRSASTPPLQSTSAGFPPPPPGSAPLPPFRRRGAQDLAAPTRTSLERIAKTGASTVNRAERRAGRSLARHNDAADRVVHRSREADRAEADFEIAEERLRSSQPYDVVGPGMESISTPVYLAASAMVFAFDYYLDAGALEVLGLSEERTIAVALVVAVSQVWLAHWAGKASRRSELFLDPHRGTADSTKNRVLTAIGIAIALVLAVIRYRFTGSALTAALFGLVGVGSFLGLRYASRLHFRPERRERQRAGRRRWWTARLLSASEYRLGRRRASLNADHQRCLISYQSAIVGPSDRALAQMESDAAMNGVPVPAITEPIWLVEAREIVAGERPPRFRGNPITGERY